MSYVQFLAFGYSKAFAICLDSRASISFPKHDGSDIGQYTVFDL
jgi:hypothetical protein